MTRPTHRMAAAATTIPVAELADVDPLIATVVAIAVAMLPDQAELHRDPERADSGWCEHRMVTHGLMWAAIAAIAVVALAPGDGRWPIALGLLVGIATHDLTDAPTISGAGLGWPLYRRPVHLLPKGWRIKTGGRIERFVLWPALAGALWLQLADPGVAGAAIAVAFMPRLTYGRVAKALRMIGRALS